MAHKTPQEFLAAHQAWLEENACPELLDVTCRFRKRKRGIRLLTSVPAGLPARLARLLNAVRQHQNAEQNLTWARVAELAGLPVRASLRNDLSDLVYRGLLITTPVGYRTPDWRVGHISN